MELQSEFGGELVERKREEVPAVPERPDLEERAEGLTMFLDDVEITSDSLYKEVNDILSESLRTQDLIVDIYKEPREYYHEKHKAVTSKQNGLVKLYKDIADIAKSKMKTYDRQQEQIRQAEAERAAREAEEIMRKQREEAAEKLAAEGRDDEAIEILDKPAPKVTTPDVKLQPSVGGVSYRDNWVARVVDPDAVPRQFLMVNEKALAAFAKATKGQQTVPGVIFENDKILSGKR